MCLSADKLFALEDRFMKQPGLYTMWTILYLVNLICLSTDSTTGPVRDFNVVCSIFSTIYTAVSSCNNIYGNKSWFELWPILKFLEGRELEENTFYGFFSPKFSLKTGFLPAETIPIVEF